MASFTLTSSAGVQLTDVGPDAVLTALQDCDDHLVLRRDDWPDRSALARRLDNGWQIELTDAEQTLVATVPVTDAALDVLRSWAEEDGWWAEAFSWQRR